MNIVHVIPSLSVRGGGGDRVCAELAESQARLGHKVTIICLNASADNKAFKPHNVEIIVCETDNTLFGRWFGASRRFEKALEARIANTDIVHIHALWRYTNKTASLLARKYHIPYIIQPHGSLHPWKLRHKFLRKWLWGKMYEKRMLNGAAAIHAESEQDRVDILKYLPYSNVYIVPCGVYSDVINRPIKIKDISERWPECRNKKVILYLGRIDVNKGIELLITCLKNLEALLEDYHLLVIGPDWSDTKKRMMKLATKLGVSDRITWGGMVTDEEKRLAFRGSDFFVLPSYSENFGITVLESLFSKCPVITTTETAWANLEKLKSGVIVEPQINALESGIKRMVAMTDSDRYRMTQNGYNYVCERFEWKTVAKETIKEYEQVIDWER